MAVLEDALNNESPDIRSAAALTFGGFALHAERAVAALLVHFSDRGERWQAIAADAAYKVPLRDDFVESLAVLLPAAPTGAGRVRNLALSSEDNDIRVLAARVLARSRIFVPDAAVVIGSTLTNGPCCARDAILAARDLQREARPFVDVICRYARSASGECQKLAIEALGSIGGSHAIGVLSTLLEDENVCGDAANSLAAIGSDAQDTLLQLIAALAASRRSEWASEWAVANLIRALRAVSPNDDRVDDAIVAHVALNDVLSDEVAMAVVQSLSPDRKNEPVFVNVLSDRSRGDDVCAAAVKALADVGDPSEDSVKALESALSSDRWFRDEAKVEVIRALSRLGVTSSLDVLKASTIEEEYEPLRVEAQKAIQVLERRVNPPNE